jgi:hypothetical protein
LPVLLVVGDVVNCELFPPKLVVGAGALKLGIGFGAEKLGVGVVGAEKLDVGGAIPPLLAPPSFSCVRPNAAIPNTAPIAM